MSKKLLLCLLVCCSYSTMRAQNVRIGFKTGLNFAHVNGPSESNTSGSDLESWKNITGFHIGATFTYKFNDYFSARGEFLYSKKGGKYTFSGDGFRTMRNVDNTKSIFTTGKLDYLVNINNTYLDFPIVGLARYKNFELCLGASAGVLIQSAGIGSLNYVSTDINAAENKAQFNLNYNYRRDDPGEFAPNSNFIIKVKNQQLEVPKTLGAYYELSEDKGSLFKAFNVDAVFGLSYYFSRALYLSGRVYYGLTDITNNEVDYTKQAANPDQSLIFRDDKDRNFVIQTSVGFSF